jgi:hypothetical protein
MKKLILVLAVIVMACTENQKIAPDVVIGDFYQGGIVFYLFQPGDSYYVNGEIHGLISSQQDLEAIGWGCNDVPQNEINLEIGEGNWNSNLIVENCLGDNAASVCLNLDYNKYDDWYLPNAAEMEQMLVYKYIIGNFVPSSYYWVSNKSGYTEAVAIRALDGYDDAMPFYTKNRVRPIRKF